MAQYGAMCAENVRSGKVSISAFCLRTVHSHLMQPIVSAVLPCKIYIVLEGLENPYFLLHLSLNFTFTSLE